VSRALLPLLAAVMFGDAGGGSGPASAADGGGGGKSATKHGSGGGGGGGGPATDVAAVTPSRSSAPSVTPVVQLLLHHSRETPARQWSETWVSALAGVARVFHRCLPTPIASRAMAGWGRALAAAAAAAAAVEAEVAAARVAALLDYSPRRRRRSWRARGWSSRRGETPVGGCRGYSTQRT